MTHCSMFKKSEEFGVIQCVIDKRFKEEFESLGFTRDGQSIIDDSEADQSDIDKAKARCKELNIPNYFNMKHETRLAKIKEFEIDYQG